MAHVVKTTNKALNGRVIVVRREAVAADGERSPSWAVISADTLEVLHESDVPGQLNLFMVDLQEHLDSAERSARREAAVAAAARAESGDAPDDEMEEAAGLPPVTADTIAAMAPTTGTADA